MIDVSRQDVTADITATNTDTTSSNLQSRLLVRAVKHHNRMGTQECGVSLNYDNGLKNRNTMYNETQCSTNDNSTCCLYKYSNSSKMYENYSIVPMKSKASDSVEYEAVNTIVPGKVEHIYEQVNMAKNAEILFHYDSLDYCQNYSPTTTKKLINLFFLSETKIHRHCTNSQRNVVYSDRLIYLKEPLHAREVVLCQCEDSVYFKYRPQVNKPDFMLLHVSNALEHYMPLYNFIKTNASSIFYSAGPSLDIFDMQSDLKPYVVVLNSCQSTTVNTQLYHRSANHHYTRISKYGYASMVFSFNDSSLLQSIRKVSYNTDVQCWSNFRNEIPQLCSTKNESTQFVRQYHPSRSSLLLLEPLLLMPDIKMPRQAQRKNRVSRLEHVKLIKIIIAYVLSFFVAVITLFYIIYFA